MVLSGKTVYYCLERLGIRANRFNCARASEHGEDDAVSTDQVIELARQCGLKAAAKKLYWGDLRGTITSRPVVLILRNGNAVLAFRNGDSVEEIVVADPLFEDGQEFFLTRDLLEPAWDGEAIIFQPLPARRKYKVRSLVSGLGLCAAALTIGLLVFDVHGAQEVVRYFVSVLQAGATNHVTASSGTDAAADNSSDVRVPTPNNEPDGQREIASLPAVVELQSIAGDSATTGADLSSVASSASNAEIHPGAAKSLIAEPEGEGATPNPEMLSPDAPESAIESQLTPKSTDLDSATEAGRSGNENPAPPNAAVVLGAEPADASAEKSTARAGGDDLRKGNVPSALTRSRNDDSTRTRMQPDKPSLSSTESAALIARGDALLSRGDLTSARLFYQRAAKAVVSAAVKNR